MADTNFDIIIIGSGPGGSVTANRAAPLGFKSAAIPRGFLAAAVIKRSRGVGGRMNSGVGFLMKKNKISVIWGEAAIDAPGKVTVKASKTPAPKDVLGPGSYAAKHIIVATGARPRVLPGLEPDKKLVWTYFEAMNPDKMPKSLLVVR